MLPVSKIYRLAQADKIEGYVKPTRPMYRRTVYEILCVWMIYDLIEIVCICWLILMIMFTMLGMNNLQSHAIHD